MQQLLESSSSKSTFSLDSRFQVSSLAACLLLFTLLVNELSTLDSRVAKVPVLLWAKWSWANFGRTEETPETRQWPLICERLIVNSPVLSSNSVSRFCLQILTLVFQRQSDVTPQRIQLKLQCKCQRLHSWNESDIRSLHREDIWKSK